MILSLLALGLAVALLTIVISRSRLKFQEAQARNLHKQGQIRQSIAILRTVVDADPRNASARWFLINLLEHFGDYDTAIACAAPFLARWNIIEDPAALNLPPEASLEHFAEVTVSAYIGLSRTTEALDLIRAFRRTMETAAPPSPVILRLHADVAERCGEIAEAIETYRLLERLDALDSTSAFNLGRLLFRRSLAEESIPPLEKASMELPDRREIAEMLADAYTAVGRHHDAWPILRTLYLDTQDRDRIRVGNKYADNLEDVGNVKGAVEILTEVAEIPGISPIDAADLLCRAGDILQKIEKPTDAARRWNRAVEIAPMHEGACRRLGLAVRPTSTHQFVRYIRGLGQEQYQKLFEKILTDWGYTIVGVDMPNPESLHLTVSRLENGMERTKLVHVKRWENEIGQFPIQELKLEVHGRKLDAGVFITMSHYSAKALVFAARSRVLELFSASEIFPLISHLELPR